MLRYLLLGLVLVCSPVMAKEEMNWVKSNGAPVVVWKSKEAYDEGKASGVTNPGPNSSISNLFNCVIPDGQTVMLSGIEGRFDPYAYVRVLDGPNKGCVGVVDGMLVVDESPKDQVQSDRRRLYALSEVAPEYCPNIERRWLIQAAIGYDRFAGPDEFNKLRADRKSWLSYFRTAGSRSEACEEVMSRFGPGGEVEIFQFK